MVNDWFRSGRTFTVCSHSRKHSDLWTSSCGGKRVTFKEELEIKRSKSHFVLEFRASECVSASVNFSFQHFILGSHGLHFVQAAGSDLKVVHKQWEGYLLHWACPYVLPGPRSVQGDDWMKCIGHFKHHPHSYWVVLKYDVSIIRHVIERLP